MCIHMLHRTPQMRYKRSKCKLPSRLTENILMLMGCSATLEVDWQMYSPICSGVSLKTFSVLVVCNRVDTYSVAADGRIQVISVVVLQESSSEDVTFSGPSFTIYATAALGNMQNTL